MKLGWSKFALERNKPGKGYSYFTGGDQDLFDLIRENWKDRIIGTGAKSIDDCCQVPVPPEWFGKKFVSTVVRLDDATDLKAEVVRRRPHEAPFIKITANGPTVPAKFVKVIMYASHELEKNGEERSGDFDWEIVSINVSDVDNEPVPPLTMARNQLEMAGGTPRNYTSDEWAASVWYWSQFVSKRIE